MSPSEYIAILRKDLPDPKFRIEYVTAEDGYEYVRTWFNDADPFKVCVAGPDVHYDDASAVSWLRAALRELVKPFYVERSP